MEIKAYILLVMAVVFNVIMDKCETVISFNDSIFRNLDPTFWCKEISAEEPFMPYTHYRIDAWHLSKSCMVICICAALSSSIWQFLMLGAVWNLTFNFLYKLSKK